MGKVYIGISGWTYAGWRRRFYPEGLAHHRELQYASRQLNAIEINGTFYSLQRPDSFARWHADTPRGFRFAVKGSRFLTHLKRLKETGPGVRKYFNRIAPLGDRSGPTAQGVGDSSDTDVARPPSADKLKGLRSIVAGATAEAERARQTVGRVLPWANNTTTNP